MFPCTNPFQKVILLTTVNRGLPNTRFSKWRLARAPFYTAGYQGTHSLALGARLVVIFIREFLGDFLNPSPVDRRGELMIMGERNTYERSQLPQPYDLDGGK